LVERYPGLSPTPIEAWATSKNERGVVSSSVVLAF